MNEAPFRSDITVVSAMPPRRGWNFVGAGGYKDAAPMALKM